MNEQNATPLWLNIKPEYLDENIDQVVSYFAKESSSATTDSFFRMTFDLLRERVRAIVTEAAGRDFWTAPAPASRQSDLVRLCLLGVFILSCGDLADDSAREALFFFIDTLSGLVPESYVEDLAEKAVLCLTREKVEFLGFGWGDIREPNAEIIAHKLLDGLTFSKEPAPEAWFQGKGSVRIRNGAAELYAGNRDDVRFAKASPSLPLFDQTLVAMSASSDRIREKDGEDIEEMERFTSDFIRESSKTRPSPEKKTKKKYSVGDIMPVRFLWQDVHGNLIVETVDEDHETIRGSVFGLRPAFMKYYLSNKVGLFLEKGDCFLAKYTDKAKRNFEIGETFLRSMVDNTIVVGSEILAELRNINQKGLMTWWTEDGYPAYVAKKDDPGNLNVGDCAYLYINARGDNGYVYATVSSPSVSYVDEEESRRRCVQDFVLKDYEPVREVSAKVLDGSLVRGLVPLLFRYQHTLRFAPERYRILCLCRILAAMAEDVRDGDFLELSCQYIRNLVAFASGAQDRIRAMAFPSGYDIPDSMLIRDSVSNLLTAYGSPDASDFLSGVIHGKGSDPLLVRLATLIQSANRLAGVYPAILPAIRREIVRFLSVETEDNTDIDESAGPDLGVENRRQEFKTSFFFAPADAQEKNQEKNVFRDVCSFLNTREGGTLYLGVNDNGGVNGLEMDLEHLEKKVNGPYRGLDGYMRYIADRAKQYFSLDVRMHLKMDAVYDGKVVAIAVEPYPFGVVEFDGVPYIRTNGESVRMSQSLRREVEARRIQSVSAGSKNVQALQEAIRDGMQVTVHGYASPSSGTVRDRRIEPFAFHGGDAYVWGYDLEDGQNKLFRVSRMGKVQITGEWKEKASHRKGETDIFNMTGERKMKVKLDLDMMARCLLVEEYPEAEGELSPLGGGHWLLDTVVYSIHGIGRFYTGLADHIRIIEAPELERYATDYFASAGKSLGKAIN